MAVVSPNTDRPVPPTTRPPYPFRTFWFGLLLLVNFLVAAYYFHIIE